MSNKYFLCPNFFFSKPSKYSICLQSLASQTEDRNAICKLKRLNVNLQKVTPCCLQTVSLPHVTSLRYTDVDDIETVGKVRLAYFVSTNFCFLNLSYKYKIKQTNLSYSQDLFLNTWRQEQLIELSIVQLCVLPSLFL